MARVDGKRRNAYLCTQKKWLFLFEMNNEIYKSKWLILFIKIIYIKYWDCKVNSIVSDGMSQDFCTQIWLVCITMDLEVVTWFTKKKKNYYFHFLFSAMKDEHCQCASRALYIFILLCRIVSHYTFLGTFNSVVWLIHPDFFREILSFSFIKNRNKTFTC